MKKTAMFVAALAAVAVAVTASRAVDPLKSGPQTGEELAGPFHPLNVTGAAAGKKHCLYCENGGNPVAVVFARKISSPLTALIKKIDACTVKNKKASMGSFVVFLSGNESLEGDLKDLAAKQGIKTTVLSIDNPAGPTGYKIAKDADVTVLLYSDRTVRANFAFRSGELNNEAVDQIMTSIPRILPKD
jgi:hypothetical protein